MALTSASLRKTLLDDLNNVFAKEYGVYNAKFRTGEAMSDVLEKEPTEHQKLRLAPTSTLRDVWLVAFNNKPVTVSEVAAVHGTDIWVVGSELFIRGELKEQDTVESFDEVYVLKPDANS